MTEPKKYPVLLIFTNEQEHQLCESIASASVEISNAIEDGVPLDYIKVFITDDTFSIVEHDITMVAKFTPTST